MPAARVEYLYTRRPDDQHESHPSSVVFVHQPRAAAVCAPRTARVRDIVFVLPKIGSVRTARILAHSGIAHSSTLAGTSERQRGELITFFRA